MALEKWKIPYLITEHWTGFNAEAPDNIYQQGRMSRWVTIAIIRNAMLVLPVCEYLGESIRKFSGYTSYSVVKNVVDTELFYYKGESSSQFTFFTRLHWVIKKILRLFFAL